MIHITGDTHGTFDFRFGKIDCEKGDHIIILGDFGFLWEQKETKAERQALEELKSIGIDVLFIDGNHENFSRLNSLPLRNLFGNLVGVVDKGIYHLRRGNIYCIEGKSFFCMGGAASIDRDIRIEGLSWWKEETHSREEIDNALENLKKACYKMDYMLTHSAPGTLKSMLLRNNNFLDPTEGFFEQLANTVDFKLWLFGHYHIDRRIGNYISIYTNWFKI